MDRTISDSRGGEISEAALSELALTNNYVIVRSRLTLEERVRERDAASLAEEEARAVVEEDSPHYDVVLTLAQANEFIARIFSDPEWQVPAPEIILDIQTESDYSGMYDAEEHRIHAHPRLLNHFLLLHEVAHACDPRDGHGARFRSHLVNLWSEFISPSAGATLLGSFIDEGVPPDEDYLDAFELDA